MNGYENTKMHTSINEAIVDWFWYRSPTNYLPNNITIKLADVTVDGQKVVQGGKISVNESLVKLTPKEWIVHGGYSADEPQVPASLRHFYDPVSIDGVSYLTDLVENYALTYNQPLPKMNAKDWALTATDNPYNWNYAKQYLGNAFYNETNRSKYLGDAYRALGEVLHLFADMGCPPHVRNDAHPAFANGYVGDPDPYEELIKAKQVLDYGTSNISADANTAVQFKNATTSSNLFEVMATFTNKNFFSEDTQYGTNITPHIDDRRSYTSPAVGSDVIYNSTDNYYYKTINGKQIKMLQSKSYLFGLGSKYTTIDLECVKSQASVLIPTIVEGGANLIKLFIPKISIEITDAKDDGSFSGIVKHTLNAEYTKEIKYNGKIKILKGNTSIGEATCINNSITGSGLSIKKDDKILAQIEIGGLIFSSTEFSVKEKPTGLDCLSSLLACTKVSSYSVANYTYVDGTSESNRNIGYPTGGESTGNWFSDAKIIWSGNNFVITKIQARNSTSISGDTVYCKMEGTLSKDGNILESFSATWIRHYLSDLSDQYRFAITDLLEIYEHKFRNIPLTTCDQYNKWFELNLNLQQANNNIVSSYTFKKETQTTGTRQSPSTKVITNRESNSAAFTKVRVSFN
jgi:hypothetical protein